MIEPGGADVRPSRLVVLLCAIAPLVVACAHVASGVRQVTYPPDFRYITDDQLRSSMGRIAAGTARLDGLSRSPGGLAEHRDEVVATLLEMERIVSRLNPSDLPTNHPLLNANLERLRQDIQEARMAAQRDPPSLGRAEAVPGSCLICHAGGGTG